MEGRGFAIFQVQIYSVTVYLFVCAILLYIHYIAFINCKLQI